MSRDSTLVMFFHMRLEKHVCNAMSHDLLLALAVVSLDHLRTPALLCDLCCYLWSESEIWRTSFAVGFSPIPDAIDCCLLLQAAACCWLLLAAAGCCCLLAAAGCCWLLLAAALKCVV
jgi:hypothetical protein